MEWVKLVQIEENWEDKFLVKQKVKSEAKIKIRGFSLKFSGTSYSFTALAEELAEKIPEYVFGPSKIKELGERKAFMQAEKYFGKKDPQTDGKYGELILFMLVESILKCPMIAYKIKGLSNFHDQVKGGDGIFLGDYEYEFGKKHEACLIGESKIMGKFAKCLGDALDSISRFHDERLSPEFNATEFIVAKNNMVLEDGVDVDAIYNSLTPGTKEFCNKILVHPIFLMYETNRIDTIEKKACIPSEAEQLIKKFMEKKGEDYLKLIKEKVEKNKELEKVFLDFFILPVNNVTKFRNEVYYQIHGVPYMEEK